MNASKHGGYSRLCIEGEDQMELKKLLLDLLTEFNPSGFEETLLVNEIAQVIWRKNRFKLAEAKAIESYSYGDFGKGEEKGDFGTAIAQDAGAYCSIPRALAAEALLDRRLWKMFDRLRGLQQTRTEDSRRGQGRPAGDTGRSANVKHQASSDDSGDPTTPEKSCQATN